jgi:hypothetical protein
MAEICRCNACINCIEEIVNDLHEIVVCDGKIYFRSWKSLDDSVNYKFQLNTLAYNICLFIDFFTA